MINGIYGIYDEATQAFLQISPCQNDKLAEMTFRKFFKERRLQLPMIYDYPDCYKLYKLAEFDDNKGTFENLPHHELVLSFNSIELETKLPS